MSAPPLDPRITVGSRWVPSRGRVPFTVDRIELITLPHSAYWTAYVTADNGQRRGESAEYIATWCDLLEVIDCTEDCPDDCMADHQGEQ